MATRVTEKATQLRNTLGKATLSALFPNDFEYYMVALELVDSRGETMEYFVFPVMPNNISQSEPQITNIKKTAGGVVSLSTNTFIPRSITLQGTFGRKFRILLGRQGFNFTALRGIFGRQEMGEVQLSPTVDINSDKYDSRLKRGFTQIKKLNFDIAIKTGYGATKILQKLADVSTGLDQFNRPYRLYFYNRTLGESWLVKVMNLDLSQTYPDSNLLWKYNLRLQAIAPLEGTKITPLERELKVLGIGVLQKGINILAQDIITDVLDRRKDDILDTVKKARTKFGASNVGSIKQFIGPRV